ncbi:MAG: S-methyl-5'-thioadenosine phosphorylase [Candidatus Hydrothermarchaeales archaeon]
MDKIAIMGGTGFRDLGLGEIREALSVETPYGVANLMVGMIEGREVIFLPRHGTDHSIPPHKINYRRNISALKSSGVGRIISINSVGGINESFSPGDIVIPDDFIDFTKDRAATFYDDSIVHVDVTEPYCPEIRRVLLEATEKVVGKVFDGGVYACTEGPRFETPAEIRMVKLLGCDVVGMVGLPEVVLAREKEMCYASICTVTNYAAGISKEKLTVSEVKEVIKKNREDMKKILVEVIGEMPEERSCGCKDALKDAKA